MNADINTHVQFGETDKKTDRTDRARGGNTVSLWLHVAISSKTSHRLIFTRKGLKLPEILPLTPRLLEVSGC